MFMAGSKKIIARRAAPGAVIYCRPAP